MAGECVVEIVRYIPGNCSGSGGEKAKSPGGKGAVMARPYILDAFGQCNKRSSGKKTLGPERPARTRGTEDPG